MITWSNNNMAKGRQRRKEGKKAAKKSKKEKKREKRQRKENNLVPGLTDIAEDCKKHGKE